MSKRLFKGTFNYSGETYILYTHVSSPALAYYNFVNQLSKKLNVGKSTVMYKFDGSRDNYYIEEVKEDETEDST